MRDRLQRALRAQLPPPVFELVRTLYWGWRQYEARFLGTRAAERFWAARSLREVLDGWGGQWHPHRDFLLKQLAGLGGFTSVLEVGCGYGQNLYRIKQRFPHVSVAGIDINPNSIAVAKKWFAAEGISDCSFFVGRAESVLTRIINKFDIVLSDAFTMFIGPDKIDRVMEGMVKVCCKHLVFVEWHDPTGYDPYGFGLWHGGRWKRNYVNLLRRVIPDYSESKISVIKMPWEAWSDEHWDKLGYVIIYAFATGGDSP